MTPDDAHERNGGTGAPPVLHDALDQLYDWMVENKQSDGMTTIRAKDGDPPLCVDLQLVAYYGRALTDEGQFAPSDESPEPEA